MGIVEQVQKILLSNSIETGVFDEVEAEPSKDTAWKAFSQIADFKPDVIIGLGGGSSMDVGKVAWMLYEHPDLAKLSFTNRSSEIVNSVKRQDM
jgi:acetaldehyde dehydrogenase/alcohol dehydrogenase